MQVVLGGFWVVSDGFCWLRIISDCFRLFAVLVATPISRHTEELSRSHVIESGHSIFLFKVKQQEKVALPPRSLKISDYFLYSIVFYVR